MRERKQGDSPSDYDREIRPRRVSEAAEREAELSVAAHAAHEADLRRVENDRWWRRVQALMPSEEPVVVQEFGTECTL